MWLPAASTTSRRCAAAMGADVATGVRVRVAANFGRCLDELQAFETERGSPEAFERLLDELFDSLVPMLERFPKIGPDLLAREPGSSQGAVLRIRLAGRVSSGATVRQLMSRDHVIVYLESPGDVTLLAIRHHRQLSFDLGGFWDV